MTPEEYVDAYQHGRSGIYPHKVAADLAAEYGISISEARDIVLRHMLKELDAAIEAGQ